MSQQLDLFAQRPTNKYLNDYLCPLCNKQISRSDYLKSVFYDSAALEWFANLITHYRHNHISSWNKCWGPGGGRYRSGWFGNYDNQKAMVNERAKRQIIRQAFPILREVGLTPEDIQRLQNTGDDTMRVANKFLR